VRCLLVNQDKAAVGGVTIRCSAIAAEERPQWVVSLRVRQTAVRGKSRAARIPAATGVAAGGSRRPFIEIFPMAELTLIVGSMKCAWFFA